MSGALIELVATGVQDAYLIGKPEVSFFRQNYKRHTNFAKKPVRLNPVGQLSKNGEITLTVPNKGDLLSHVWVEMGGGQIAWNGWCNSKADNTGDGAVFELWIGGQMVDRQDAFYVNQLYTQFLADNPSKAIYNPTRETWLPLQFWFCADGQYIPLVALQYQEVEIKVKFGSGADPDSGTKFYAEYILLDTNEREILAQDGQELLITQVQKIQSHNQVPDSSGGSAKFDLSLLNHPVKGLMWGLPSLGGTTVSSWQFGGVQMYLNGTEVFGDKMSQQYFSNIQPYYYTENTITSRNLVGNPATGMYSFAQKLNKFQPTGTCNFSRLDNADLTVDTAQVDDGTHFVNMYALNYNILRFKGGMAGVAFAN